MERCCVPGQCPKCRRCLTFNGVDGVRPSVIVLASKRKLSSRTVTISPQKQQEKEFYTNIELVGEALTCGAKSAARRTNGWSPGVSSSQCLACCHRVFNPSSNAFSSSGCLCTTAELRAENLSSNLQRAGWRLWVRWRRMAMTLAGDRMAMVSSPGYAHVSLASSTSAASSLSMLGWSHRRTRSAGAWVAVGSETGRLVGGRGVAGSSGAALVCRSSVSPLSDGNGNVAEFQSEEEFNTILSEAGDKLIVVDVSTTTCGPCKMIFPKFVEMSLTYPDAVFLKINGDTNAESRALMRKWGVRAVPNFRFFKNGEQVHSHTGAKVDELKTRITEHYGQPIKV